MPQLRLSLVFSVTRPASRRPLHLLGVKAARANAPTQKREAGCGKGVGAVRFLLSSAAGKGRQRRDVCDVIHPTGAEGEGQEEVDDRRESRWV